MKNLTVDYNEWWNLRSKCIEHGYSKFEWYILFPDLYVIKVPKKMEDFFMTMVHGDSGGEWIYHGPANHYSNYSGSTNSRIGIWSIG